MSGRQTRKPVDRHDFKIGIMCALVLEANLVEKIFDQRWNGRDHNYGKARGDPNAYTTGVIADQNVVLAHCPHMGSNGAAQVATWLKASFTGIEVIFVVGICGAVPAYDHEHEQRPEEIFLGDCIISTAVVQYDFGRRESHGFKMKGDLDGLGRPGLLTKGIMAKLQTEENRSDLTKDLKSHLQVLQQKHPERAFYPGSQHDRMYCEKNCTDLGCGNQYHELRARPENHISPSIHFGYFGSSNTVLRSGIDRDELADAHKIIAFEMEASGVWDICQTIVIKAACDYADSHKNKIWQKYAAAVAAAGLKAFLSQADLSERVLPSPGRIARKSVPSLTREILPSLSRESTSSLSVGSATSLQSKNLVLPAYAYSTATISADFRWMAYGEENKSIHHRDATVIVYDVQNSVVKYTLPAEKETHVRSLAFDSRGKWLATAHGGYWHKPRMKSHEYLPVRIRLWSMETGRWKWTADPHTRKSVGSLIITMAFNSKGDQLAVVYSSSTDKPNGERPSFFVVDVNNGNVIHKSISNPSDSRLGHFSQDDRQYLMYRDKEVAILSTTDHQGLFPIPVSHNDFAIFKLDGSLLVMHHDGDINTHFPNGIIKQKQKLKLVSDLSFDEYSRILGRLTTEDNLIIVVTNPYLRQLWVASPDAGRCGILSSNSNDAKVLDISLDGQCIAWCELEASRTSCRVHVCNVEEKLQMANIQCYLEDVD